jgi:hypothetical protein
MSVKKHPNLRNVGPALAPFFSSTCLLNDEYYRVKISLFLQKPPFGLVFEVSSWQLHIKIHKINEPDAV